MEQDSSHPHSCHTRRQEETLTPKSCCQEQPGWIHWEAAQPQDGALVPSSTVVVCVLPAGHRVTGTWSDSDRLGLPLPTGSSRRGGNCLSKEDTALSPAWKPCLDFSIPPQQHSGTPTASVQQFQDQTFPLLPPSSSCNICSESKPSTEGAGGGFKLHKPMLTA